MQKPKPFAHFYKFLTFAIQISDSPLPMEFGISRRINSENRSSSSEEVDSKLNNISSSRSYLLNSTPAQNTHNPAAERKSEIDNGPNREDDTNNTVAEDIENNSVNNGHANASQELPALITGSVYKILEIGSELGTGSFGTVSKALIEITGSIVNNTAGKIETIQQEAAIKRMNGDTDEISQISSYLKQVIGYFDHANIALNDPHIKDKIKTEYIDEIRKCLGEVGEQVRDLSEILLENLDQFNQTLTGYIETYQSDQNLKNIKTKVEDGIHGGILQRLENLTKEFLSKLEDHTPRQITEWTGILNEVVVILDSMNLQGNFEKLKALTREIYNNCHIYLSMVREAQKESSSLIEYAEKRNLALCFSAIPSDEDLVRLNDPANDQDKDKAILKWAYETAQRILKAPDGGIIFSLVPGKSMFSVIQSSEFDNLTPRAKLGILKGLFQAMVELDKAGLIHNDVHRNNINIATRSQNKADGYLLDYGVCLMAKNPDKFKDAFARRHRLFVAPEIYEGNIEKIGKKCNTYAIGTYILSIIFGSAGEEALNRYFYTFEVYKNRNHITDKAEEIFDEKVKNFHAKRRGEYITEGKPEFSITELDNLFFETKKFLYEDIDSGILLSDLNEKYYNIFTKNMLNFITNLARDTLSLNPDNRITSEEARNRINEIIGKLF